MNFKNWCDLSRRWPIRKTTFRNLKIHEHRSYCSIRMCIRCTFNILSFLWFYIWQKCIFNNIIFAALWEYRCETKQVESMEITDRRPVRRKAKNEIKQQQKRAAHMKSNNFEVKCKTRSAVKIYSIPKWRPKFDLILRKCMHTSIEP